MARKQFLSSMGKYDTATPSELYRLVREYQIRHNLRTQYGALVAMLQFSISMDRTPMERRMGAEVDSMETEAITTARRVTDDELRADFSEFYHKELRRKRRTSDRKDQPK